MSKPLSGVALSVTGVVRGSDRDGVPPITAEMAVERASRLEAVFDKVGAIEEAEEGATTGSAGDVAPINVENNAAVSVGEAPIEETADSLADRQASVEQEEDDMEFFDDEEEDDEDEEDDDDLHENDPPVQPVRRRSSKWIHTTSPQHAKRQSSLTAPTLQKINAIIKRFPKVPKTIPHKSEAKSSRAKTIGAGANSALEWATGLWK